MYLVDDNVKNFTFRKIDWQAHIRAQFLDAYILCAFKEDFFVGWNSSTGRVLVSDSWSTYTPYKMTGFGRDFFSTHSEEEGYTKVHLEALYQGLRVAEKVLATLEEPSVLDITYDEFFVAGKVRRHYLPLIVSPRPLGPRSGRIIVRKKIPSGKIVPAQNREEIAEKLKVLLEAKYQKERRTGSFFVVTWNNTVSTRRTNISSRLIDWGDNTIVAPWSEVDKWFCAHHQRGYNNYKDHVEDFWTWLVQNYKI